jgi:excisionase family DNA binding protein
MLTTKEVAAILKVSYDSALEFIKHSGIDYIKVGRQYRVSEEKLKAFLMKKGSTIVDISEQMR